MDVLEFFQHCGGKWFSQCTHHHLGLNQAKSTNSDVVIAVESQIDASILALCEATQVDVGQVLCSLQSQWENKPLLGRKKTASSLMVILQGDSKSGQFLRTTLGETAPTRGHYALGNDEAMTLLTGDPTHGSTERLWFASPNLRLRTSLLRQADGAQITSFYSEIRLNVSPPAEA